jgi:hypothetical protein
VSKYGNAADSFLSQQLYLNFRAWKLELEDWTTLTLVHCQRWTYSYAWSQKVACSFFSTIIYVSILYVSLM